MVNKIPIELLIQYTNLIRFMEQCRICHNISSYRIADQERVKIHEKICQIVGISRDNADFARALDDFMNAVLPKKAA